MQRQAEKSHNLLSARWRPWRAGDAAPVQIWNPETQGSQWCKSHGETTNFSWAQFLYSAPELRDWGEGYLQNPLSTHALTTQKCRGVSFLWGEPWPMGSRTSPSQSRVDNSEAIQHGPSESPKETETQFPTTTLMKTHLCTGFPSFPVLLSPVPWDYCPPSPRQLQCFYSSLGLNPCFPGRTQANTATLVFWYLFFFFFLVKDNKRFLVTSDIR